MQGQHPWYETVPAVDVAEIHAKVCLTAAWIALQFSNSCDPVGLVKSQRPEDVKQSPSQEECESGTASDHKHQSASHEHGRRAELHPMAWVGWHRAENRCHRVENGQNQTQVVGIPAWTETARWTVWLWMSVTPAAQHGSNGLQGVAGAWAGPSESTQHCSGSTEPSPSKQQHELSPSSPGALEKRREIGHNIRSQASSIQSA